MSTGINSKERSGILSYLPAGITSPRRRSISNSLPRTSNGANSSAPWDPFEKSGRQSGPDHPGILEKLRHSWVTSSQRSRWIKTGGVLFFVFVFLYYLSGNAGENTYTTLTSPTAKCTRPHDPSKPLVQYAIMIDAGSTGSRIHVYKFNNCGPTPELEHEEFKMTEKRAGGSGLSSYGSDADGAAKSLDMLLDVAMKTVPDEYKSCTPLAVKATAGLRLLGEEKSTAILEAVRTHLETDYPFPVVSREHDGVVIMPGEQEGVYAWITTNYLLGKIGGPDKTPTAAIFDLGGGSTQIVFEPTFPISSGGMPTQMEEGDHKYTLDFGGRHFNLYQHSHLGYGLMSARESLHRLVVNNAMEAAAAFKGAKSGASLDFITAPVPHPCFPPGMTKRIKVVFPTDHPLGVLKSDGLDVDFEGPGNAIPAQCRRLVEDILYKDKECNLAPCSFNGVHQPSFPLTFAREDVYTFSYFYDRTSPLGMPESFTLRELFDLTETVCGGKDHWDAFVGIEDAVKDLKERPEWCLDLNFMGTLLHTGYEMPIDREVRIAKKIKGNELGWCLGASLPLLEKNSGWQCRVKQLS